MDSSDGEGHRSSVPHYRQKGDSLPLTDKACASTPLIRLNDPLSTRKPDSINRKKNSTTPPNNTRPSTHLSTHHPSFSDIEDIDGSPPPSPLKYTTKEMTVRRDAEAGSNDGDGDGGDGGGGSNQKGLVESLRGYPPSVFFMLGNEFCERFSFYGMRAILVIYLVNEHHFTSSTATFIYHAFTALAYISPMFGSIAADNYFGRFKVILWVSLVYVAGHAMLAVGSIPYSQVWLRGVMDALGLVVIALATGGIKPCVSAFAADQFDEDKVRERTQFFSFFYFAINAGSLLAIMLTPILRGHISCFGSQYCFPLAFGVPGVLMLVAFLIFLSGWRCYKIRPVGKGNVIWKVCKCIGFSIKKKVQAKLRGEDKAEHWLDYGRKKFSDSLVAGVKSMVAVSMIFVPVVFFWALFDQQGSTWVLQARRMDGRVGPITILPDQMNIFNPLVVLLMVPIFEAYIYPALRRVCRVTALRKMAAGGLLVALSFVLAGFLQLKINDTMEPKPSTGNVFIQRMGNSTAPYSISGGVGGGGGELELEEGKNEWPAGNYTLTRTDNTSSHDIELDESKCGYVIGLYGGGVRPTVFPYSCEKSDNGKTRIYLLVAHDSPLIGQRLFILDHKGKVTTHGPIRAGAALDIQPGLISSPDYTIAYGPGCSRTPSGGVANCSRSGRAFFAQMGAAHVLDLEGDSSLTVVRSNSVNILWMLPQFYVITLGEVLLSVTGLEFSYSQAAPTMKSVLQALWLMTTFFGNLIDMGISGTHLIQEPAMEFFFYAMMMVVVMGVFIWMAMHYTYANEHAMEESIASSEGVVDGYGGKEKEAAGKEPGENELHQRRKLPPIDTSATKDNSKF